MLDVSLRELEYVIAVHEERNVTRAAARLHMAQPALSQAILRLERRLGTTLFTRTSRRVEPTAAGEILAGEAHGIIEDVRTAMERVRQAPRVLSVHVSEPALETPRRLLSALRSSNPGLSIRQTTLPDTPRSEAPGEAHLSLTIGGSLQVDGLSSEVFRSERVGALVCRTHPVADADYLTPEQMVRFPLVSIDDRLSTWNTWITCYLAEHGLSPTWTKSIVFGIAAGSDMVMGQQSMFICLETVGAAASHQFRWLPLGPDVRADWYLNWPQRQANSPELQSVLEAARSYASGANWV